MKEYHLYLYKLNYEGMVHTYTDTMNAIKNNQSLIGTTQLVTCTGELFDKGYRIFIHPKPHDMFEITLGACVRTDREIRKAHCLWHMLISGAFEGIDI